MKIEIGYQDASYAAYPIAEALTLSSQCLQVLLLL